MSLENAPASNQKIIGPLKRIGGMALAGPGALSVVGELSEKLSISELLTRIVVNFRSVTTALWQQLEGVLHFKLPLDPSSLTIICLLVVPTFFQRKSLAGRSDGQTLITLSLIFTYLLTLYFFSTPSIRSLLILSAAYLVSVLVFSKFQRDEGNFDFLTRGLLWCFVVTLLLQYHWVDPFYLLDFLFSEKPQPLPPSGPNALSLLPVIAVMAITVRRICLGSPGPLHVALLASGILAIDAFSRIVKPAVEAWLTSVGA